MSLSVCMVVNVAQGIVSWINMFNTHTHTHTHTLAGVFRRNYSEVLAEKAAPTIPVQPISYADAIHFMRCVKWTWLHTGILCMHTTRYIAYPSSSFSTCLLPFLSSFFPPSLLPSSQLDGNEAPPSWQGQLGITYYITQQETNQSKSVSVNCVTVHEKLI